MDAAVLYRTLDRRPRPEDVAELILRWVGPDLTSRERSILDRAARRSLARGVQTVTSMLEDFARPVPLDDKVTKANELFDRTELGVRKLSVEDACDVAAVRSWLAELGWALGMYQGRSDFKHDRMDRAARRAAGIELSKRQYNKLFRFVGRFEDRLRRYARELRKYELRRVGKSGLATRLDSEVFAKSPSSAAFVAYYAARASLRSEFTIEGQQRPFDEIAAMLFARCERDPSTSWLAIAHVYPAKAVLRRLAEAEKGHLLGRWYAVLEDAGRLLESLYRELDVDRATMVVRPGMDSSTWNDTASAWNQARKHWFALVHALGVDAMFEDAVPGKVMRLMAADVVAWHRSAGARIDPQTEVWASLPLPWDVLRGQVLCSRGAVEQACRRAGVDPVATGWLAPFEAAQVQSYRPTPELVHGVAVSCPALAHALRKAGVFSGKSLRGETPAVVIERDRHGFATGARLHDDGDGG